MNVRFACPGCQHPASLQVPGPTTWQCPECDHLLEVPPREEGAADAGCVVCGNRELYKKKNFPHWLGLSILTVACATFFVGHLVYHPWAAWAILIASAVLDGGLYLWVGDVVVCYRCGAHYYGQPADPEQKPFELGVAERYRQERLRREHLKKG